MKKFLIAGSFVLAAMAVGCSSSDVQDDTAKNYPAETDSTGVDEYQSENPSFQYDDEDLEAQASADKKDDESMKNTEEEASLGAGSAGRSH